MHTFTGDLQKYIIALLKTLKNRKEKNKYNRNIRTIRQPYYKLIMI